MKVVVFTVDFNAWVFEGSDKLMPSLINEVITAVEDEYGGK